MIARRTALMSLLALPLGIAGSQTAAAAGPVNAEGGLGLAGHDPVAYHTDRRATPGNPAITATRAGIAYRFATDANRAAFLADPDRYLPQYGGYCAFGMARGYKAVVDPMAFTIAGEKLYLNYNADIQTQWRRQQTADIARADANWPTVINSPDVAR